MRLKYFMKPDSNIPPAYSYCEGEDTDSLYNADTCIDVPKQPSVNHVYNMDKKAWEINEEMYMADLRLKRNAELDRTDYLMNPDYPITEENITIIKTYRQALRDCPAIELIADRVLPACPSVCKKKVGNE